MSGTIIDLVQSVTILCLILVVSIQSRELHRLRDVLLGAHKVRIEIRALDLVHQNPACADVTDMVH